MYRWRVFLLFALWPFLLVALSIPCALLRIFSPSRGRRFTWEIVIFHASRAFLKAARVKVLIPQSLARNNEQRVYIFNHSSSLDLFIVAALGLKRTRTFMKRAMWALPPLGLLSWASGTFFTVPQQKQKERRKIFARACEQLEKSGDSVFLSPEGTRHLEGVGPFNRGAFHLALSMKAPIVPLYIHIAEDKNPGRSWFPKEDTLVEVKLLEQVETSTWNLQTLSKHIQDTRELYLAHEGKR